jgi:hypothetical protein
MLVGVDLRRAFVLMVLATSPMVGGLAAPASGSANQLECAHPEIEAAIQTPAVVGIPWRPFRGTFWCLETGDELSDATINWGDGSVSPGSVSYSEPEASTVIAGTSIEPVMVKTGYIGGSHVYTRAPREGLSFTATDLPGGMVLTAHRFAPVLSRDIVHGAPLHIAGRVWNGVVAEVWVPGVEYYSHVLSARIYWGDGRSSPGRVGEPTLGRRNSPVRYRILGYHRWRQRGAHAIRVVVSDKLGPQHYVVRDHVVA